MAVLAQKTCMYGCNLVLHQFKFNTGSMSRFMKPRMEITGGFLLQPRNFLSKNHNFEGKLTRFVIVLAQNTYSWIGPPGQPDKQLICQQTVVAIYIPRPPLERSRQDASN